ncbi:MAG TPA: transglycosylase SLT domain-containing protein [Steroidobacteraceae bacterium]|jgi:soluble lytic murein transglycosylase
MRSSLPLAAALCGVLLSTAASGAKPVKAPVASEEGRQDFVDAMLRVKLHLPDQPDSHALKAYAIYEYLEAARLRRDLAVRADEDLDAHVADFLQAHANEPVVRALHHDWLVSLALRQRWDLFLASSAETTDPALICQRLAARLTAGDVSELGKEALARWSLPQKPPPTCAPVFAWLHEQNLITPALAEARTRSALLADNARLAREFAADVPVAEATDYLRWADLLDAPKSALNILATHKNLPVEPEALQSGFDKLCRTDIQAALELLPELLSRDGTTPALRAHLKRSAALGAAYDRDPRALALFEELPSEALDAQVYEWRARASLYHGDFALARSWIEEMPADLATQPRWRYWRARSIEATDGETAAAPLYTSLAELRDYYGYLAADRVRLPYKLNAHALPDDEEAQRALAAEPGMVRAHELFECDEGEDAIAEWSQALSGAGNALKVQAAQLAARWDWYTEAITTLAQTGEFDDVQLRYPKPFRASVEGAAKLSNLPPDWIFAVMRQESLFRKDAVSRADARGLMQMLPVTASAVGRRWHLKMPNRDALFDPVVAIPLGAAYFRELLDRDGNNLPVTLAAYNAGPAAVERWRPFKPLDADVWVENIPYNETRGYIQHIIEHIVAYAYVRDAEPPRLETLMPRLEPSMPVL